VKVLVTTKKHHATKIRRLYDVLNVLECIGVLEKKKYTSKAVCGYRTGGLPTAWTWVCTAPPDLRAAFLQAPPSPVRGRKPGPAAKAAPKQQQEDKAPPKHKKDSAPRAAKKTHATGLKRKRSDNLTLH
jgi:hypothetical protein